MDTKIYRIEDIVFTELSRNKGSIEYHLIDSIKNKRKVTGIAKLGLNRKIKSVKAVYHREKPLIDALVEADVDQRISVDFTEFNKISRVRTKQMPNIKASTRANGEISATMVYQEIYDDIYYSEKVKNVLPDMSRLGVWAVFLFVIWMAFMAINQFAKLVS